MIFIWLPQLSPLVGPPTNISENCGKSNGDISNRESGDELGIEEKLPTDPNRTENKSLSHNYGKSNSNMSDGGSSKKIGKEKKPPTDSDCTESKSLSCNRGKNNGNMSDGGAAEGVEIEDLEGAE